MKKLSLIVFSIIICILIFPFSTKADSGPKPSLTIIVEGMGDGQYWLDLLVSGEPRYTWLKISDEERQRVSKLAEYSEDGLHAALLKGTDRPMNGSITGKKQPDGSYVHKFTYMGVPETFKIAILKSDGTIIVSDTIKRKHFQSLMKYDPTASKITEKADPNGTIKETIPWGSYLSGFFQRMMVTLIIEIGTALLFGFTLKKSWKPLLFTNIATQILLNVIILSVTSQNGEASFYAYFGAELLVIVVEAVIYSRLLIEQALKRRIQYTLTANALSLFIGFTLFYLP